MNKAVLINNQLLTQNKIGLWINGDGNSGYHTHFTGAWVCYYCGQLCLCGEEAAE
jgi:hypothetical protein